MTRPKWEIVEKREPIKRAYQIVIQGKDRIVKIADVYNCTEENIQILQTALERYEHDASDTT